MKDRLFFLIFFLCISFMLKAADKPVIKISTENVDLIDVYKRQVIGAVKKDVMD